MLLREFLELGKTCKVCGSIEPKGISVKTSWTDRLRDVEFKDNSMSFKFDFATSYELFKFNVDTHHAEREIYNPTECDMMYSNNFTFRVHCKNCDSYSFESSLITFHPLGSVTTDVSIFAEEIFIQDGTDYFKIRNLIHSDKISMLYHLDNERDGTIEFPFMSLKDFPIKDREKMLKKIRTLLLLS